jgi:hypothetical protein
MAVDTNGNWSSDIIQVNVDNAMSLTANLDPEMVQKGAAFTISGTLSDSQGAGLEGVDVCARVEGSTSLLCQTTTAGGAYTISAVAPTNAGAYLVNVSATQFGMQTGVIAPLTVIDPNAGHDLAVHNVHLSSYSVPINGWVTCYATFENDGQFDEPVIVHWYLYMPGQDTPVYQETRDYGTVGAQGGSTGEKWVELKTLANPGTWNAVVWVELANDEDPSNNRVTVPFFVGFPVSYEEYGRFDQGGALPGPFTDGNSKYSVTVDDVYPDGSAQYTIEGGPTTTLTPDEAFFYDNNRLVILHEWGDEDDDHVMFQMWTYPPPIGFSVEPKSLSVLRGGRATYRVTCANSLYDWYVSRITADGITVENWNWQKDTVNETAWDLYCDVPLSAQTGKYEFWWALKFLGDKCAQKVELIVMPEHDISLSNLLPASGSAYDPGSKIPISVTVTAANGYRELPTVAVHISGPEGYSYRDSEEGLVRDSLTVPFLPDWDTVGLTAGDYTITVTASIENDSNPANNSISSNVTINMPPELSVSAYPDATDHAQGDAIELRAIVTHNGSSVTDADVVANVNWPGGALTHPVMAYDAVDGRYECVLSASQIGAVSGTVTASKSGFTSGTAPFAEISVSNVPPDTTIVSPYPAEGEWVPRTTLSFSWIGSDSGTAVSNLLYSWKMDASAWSEWTAQTTALVQGLTDGGHIFYVKSYDGFMEDSTAAQRAFSVDTAPPTVTVITNGGNGPGVDFETETSSVIIEGTASDGTPSSGLSSIAVTGGATNEGNLSIWRFSVSLSPGANMIVVTALDGAGNCGQYTIAVTYSVPPPEIWFVDREIADPGDGKSWAQAFRFIEDAVAAAASGDEIWVKKGTYYLVSAIAVDKEIYLYGGFRGDESEREQRDWMYNVTTVDGYEVADHGFHVTADCIIDGFTITRGHADGSFTPHDRGGGILVDGDCFPVITNCIFKANYSNSAGGAIYNAYSSPTITNCIFYANEATHSSETVNTHGGAIFNAHASPNVTNCTFYGNTAKYGGAVDSYRSNPVLTNCILWGDTAQEDGQEIYQCSNSNTTFDHCNVDQDGYAGANGNIRQDPLFRNAPSEDFRLEANSPCVDKGFNGATGLPLTDFGGYPRVYDGDDDGTATVDMGAHEYIRLSSALWYVNGDMAVSGDGTGWARAFKTIQEAVDAAGEESEIWVSQGTYALSDPISVDKVVALYSGFDGTETERDQRDPRNHLTVVDAQGTSGCFHVSGSVTIDGFVIRGAGSGQYDSGIWLEGDSELHVNRCRIEGNGYNGIVVFGAFELTNSMVSGNSNRGITLTTGSESTIVNCTVVENGASGIHVVGTAPAALIMNNILAYNYRGIQNASSTSTVELSFNNVYGNDADYYGPGLIRDTDISEDPLFVDHENGDCHIRAGSLCIDQGTNAVATPLSTDFEGTARVLDGDGDGTATVDIGAIEYEPGTYCTLGDINCNGVVELTDAILTLQVLSGLSPDPVYSGGEVDGDGKIGCGEAVYILQHLAELRNP